MKRPMTLNTRQPAPWTRATAAVGLSLLGLAGLSACGGESDKNSEEEPSSTGDIDLNPGVTGDDVPGLGIDSSQEGGRVELTDKQVDQLQNASCTGWSGEGESLPAILQLVVDVSGSMDDEAPGSRNSKWEATRAALEEALATMPPSVSVGMLLYPNQETQNNSSPGPVTDCVAIDDLIGIAPLGQDDSAHRDTLMSLLEDANVGSRTPTFDAYSYALNTSLIPDPSRANKFMLLITDGAPTLGEGCTGEEGGRRQGGGGAPDAPTEPIVESVANAYNDHGIRTFLIGSPGSEQSSRDGGQDMRPWLSEAAILGGTAPDDCQQGGPDFCHLDMTQEADFATALSEGLMAISGQIIDSCTFAVPSPPDGQSIDPNLTNLVVDWGSGSASLILPDGTGECSDGWHFNAAGDVVLCPATCDEVKLDSDARVHLTFGCGSEQIDTIVL